MDKIYIYSVNLHLQGKRKINYCFVVTNIFLSEPLSTKPNSDIVENNKYICTQSTGAHYMRLRTQILR